MSTLSCRAVIAVALAGAVWAQDSLVVKAVAPEWDLESTDSLVTVPVWVTMSVLPDGTPYDVKAESGLPMAAVRALAKYEMRPNSFAYAIGFPMQIKRPLRGFFGVGSAWPDDLTRITREASRLNAKRSAEMEKKLAEDPRSVEARSALVMWSAEEDDPASQELRARQVAWLVGNAPKAEILRHPSAWVDGPEYDRLRQLWLNHLRTTPAAPQEFLAAAMFLRFRDPELAEGILKTASSVSSINMSALGELYAFSAIGVQSLEAKSRRPKAPGAGVQISEFGRKARAILSASTDVRLLVEARDGLAAVRSSTAEEIPEFDAICADVLRQLKTVHPDGPSDCGKPKEVIPPAAAERKPTGIQQAVLMKQPKPVYPPDARQRRIQGTVMFFAIIAKDGRVKQLDYVSGPLPLVASAYDSVLRWEYRPTILNGEPTEVATDIEVNFVLN